MMERRVLIILKSPRKIVNFHDVLRKRQWKERAVFGVFSSLLLFSAPFPLFSAAAEKSKSEEKTQKTARSFHCRLRNTS